MAHFREELREIPDLEQRARRLVELEKECLGELRQIRARLCRDMANQGKTMQQIADAFGVSRQRAHQMARAAGYVRPVKVKKAA